MPTIAEQARPVVEKLLKAEETQLYEELGIRAKAIAQDLPKASSFEPMAVYDSAQMGLKEDVLDFGQRLFRRWSAEAHKLICGGEPDDEADRKGLAEAFGVGETSVAAALCALMVTHLGVAPALAAVAGALIARRFFRPAYDEFCQVWGKSLSQGS
jgi:hypothetical protein